jgi:hypothetical protein
MRETDPAPVARWLAGLGEDLKRAREALRDVPANHREAVAVALVGIGRAHDFATNWLPSEYAAMVAMDSARGLGEHAATLCEAALAMDAAALMAQQPAVGLPVAQPTGATHPSAAERTATPAPAAAKTTVVLWEGAEPTGRNLRLARTRAAYLEAHGNVAGALAALEREGNAIGKSTFYDHLDALDIELPGWRSRVLLSGSSGNLEVGVRLRRRGKTRAKSG